jgi:UDP-2,4-diacetamido-2,4,6-trideoxy-beta-L-altropyranose hydrolase
MSWWIQTLKLSVNLMKVAFRTDASNQMGTGHFMRCLTLAEALKKQGADIRFISRNLPVHLSDMLNTKGIELTPLSANDLEASIDELAHASWLGASQTQDSKATIQALSDQVWDWLVVDHYALDFRWENALRQSVKNIMSIDDLADRNHDCDILLDQNYYTDMQTRYSGKVPAKSQLLFGPRYALLREEFLTLREQVKIRTGDVKKILVFFGGIDAENYTFQTIEVLSEINSEFKVDVVIGAQHPFKSQIEASCSKKGFFCHVQTPHMAKLMADADLAIGAGGSASWERCCLGLPSLLIAIADNQIAIAKELDSINGCAYLGSSDLFISLDLKKCLSQILSNPEKIQKISEKAFSIVDGLGAFRVSDEMRVCL